ncbi:MAG TPA: hypothetical protein VIE65_02140 [Methylobacter sp.]|jgi:dCTP deaminase
MNTNQNGGILSGLEIREMVARGDIVIDPWDSSHINDDSRLNPASYDLTLGDEIAVYKDVVSGLFEYPSDSCFAGLPPGHGLKPTGIKQFDHMGVGGIIDAKKKNPVQRYRMNKETGFLLKPGIGYLMHTAERIRTDNFVPILDGKSSIGRLFIAIHITAGFGDPGFNGQYTLEVTAIHPVIIYPGMKFCQIRFHTIVGDVRSYKQSGNYQGDFACGPVESRSWRMFE